MNWNVWPNITHIVLSTRIPSRAGIVEGCFFVSKTFLTLLKSDQFTNTFPVHIKMQSMQSYIYVQHQLRMRRLQVSDFFVIKMTVNLFSQFLNVSKIQYPWKWVKYKIQREKKPLIYCCGWTYMSYLIKKWTWLSFFHLMT